MFLRAATEFEFNCKRILEENGYARTSYLDMSDYAKLSSVLKLPEYMVTFRRWTTPRVFKPFVARWPMALPPLIGIWNRLLECKDGAWEPLGEEDVLNVV